MEIRNMWTGKLSWGIISRSNFVKVFTSYYKYRPGHLGACYRDVGEKEYCPLMHLFPLSAALHLPVLSAQEPSIPSNLCQS